MPGGDEGFEYVVGMRDEMAAPAKHAASGLDELTSALERSEAAGSKHASIIGRVSGEHGKLSFAARESAGTLREFASDVLPGLVGIASAVGAMKFGFEAVKFSVEASEFKENAIAAYTVVKGTAEEGERTFQELDKTAREIHMPAERAHEIAQRLMLEGLESQKAVTDTVRAIGDLQSVGLEAGASKIQAIVERSVTAGHFEIGKGARGLKGTGVTFDTLAAELGMGRKQFEAELKAGKISAETGIEAIDQVVLKGKVGALATKKFTISDALVDMKNNIRGVLQETDAGPVVDAFKRMSEAFTESGDNAKDTKEAINSLIELGGGLIDLASGIGTTLVGAINLLKGALLGARDAAGWLLDKLHGVAGSAASIFQTAADKRWSAQAEKDVDAREDRALRKRIEEGKIHEVQQFAATPGHTAAETHALGKKLGIDLYAPGSEEAGGAAAKDERTMRESLRGATGAASVVRKFDVPPREDLHATGKQAGHSLESGIKDALQMHSPSRVMFDIGENAGFSLASGHKAAAVAIRTDDVAAPPTQRGGKQVSVQVEMGGFHFQGQANADEFLPLLESQVADVFERIALEMGG